MGNKCVIFGIVGCMTGFLGSASSGATQVVAAGARPETVTLAAVTVDVVDAPLTGVLKTIVRQAGLRATWDDKVIDSDTRITLHLRQVSADEAFARVLVGTGMRAKVSGGYVVISREAAPVFVAQGGITGKIMDVQTRLPLHGATVTLDESTQRGSQGVSSKGTTSKDDGTFRFSDVTSGPHMLRVRLLGYVKATKAVTVTEGQVVAVDVGLEPSVNALDQVVVTGTVVATSARALPNTITIITAKQIQDRGITQIDQLFHGDVPGIYATVAGAGTDKYGAVEVFSRGATVATAGASSPPIKTYVDGVELTEPQYMSQIDVNSIERIEIIPGPQASTIYGSDALSGVMQIFTKKQRAAKSARPTVEATLSYGTIENNYTSSLTPSHDDNITVRGGDDRSSYNAGAGWRYDGAWQPLFYQKRASGYVGLMHREGPVEATLSGRLTKQNIQQGVGDEFLYAAWQAGILGYNRSFIVPIWTVATNGQQTLGFTGTYHTLRWWQNEITLGNDASNRNSVSPIKRYSTASDTNYTVTQFNSSRSSATYRSTVNLETPYTQLTVSAGADYWRQLFSVYSVSSATPVGTLTGTPLLQRNDSKNKGGFVQAQLAIFGALYLTGGVRFERNPNYGSAYGTNVAPRYGVSYVLEHGALSAKLRGAYGRATRPPTSDQKMFEAIQPGIQITLANDMLAPEFQRGSELGVDLAWGSRMSLQVTRYDQYVQNLIVYMPVDTLAVPSNILVANSTIPGFTPYFFQNQNIGTIRNYGWEAQGALNMGPVELTGTYSMSTSRLTYVAPGALFTYQPGQMMFGVPEHLGAITMQYAHGRTALSITEHITGQTPRFDQLAWYARDQQFARIWQGWTQSGGARLTAQAPFFYKMVPFYATTDVNVAHDLSRRLNLFMRGTNVSNHYLNEYQNSLPTTGRTMVFGARLRWN